MSLGDVSMLLHSAGPGGTGSVAGSPLGGGFGAGAGGGLRAAYAAADWNGGNGEKQFFLKNAAATEKSNRLDADGGGPLTPHGCERSPCRVGAGAGGDAAGTRGAGADDGGGGAKQNIRA